MIEVKMYQNPVALIEVSKIINESLGERDLIPYLIKLQLLEKGIPIQINVCNIREQKFEKELCYEKINENLYLVEYIK